MISRTTLSPVQRPCKPLKNIATGDSSPACSTKINQAETKPKILVFQIFLCCSPVFHIYDLPIHTNVQSGATVLFWSWIHFETWSTSINDQKNPIVPPRRELIDDVPRFTPYNQLLADLTRNQQPFCSSVCIKGFTLKGAKAWLFDTWILCVQQKTHGREGYRLLNVTLYGYIWIGKVYH